jgi:DNA sulfur modification protein DndC
MEAERNKPLNRWKRRRNGKSGLGPMTLEWRKIALSELLAAQLESGFDLIEAEEIAAIHQEWKADDPK